MKNVTQIFGEAGQTIMTNLSTLVGEFRDGNIVYNFLSEDEFRDLASRDMGRAGIQYWQEILDRAHFSSATAIIRTVNWVRAIDSAYEDDNFLSFMSSVRALTEFSGDTIHSLNLVPLTIAENSSEIKRMLGGNSNPFISSSDLENSLIHYTHARKVKNGEDSADSHRAERTHVYVKSLEPYAPRIYDMYTELCGYAHPAAQSVGAHMRSLNENDWSLTVDPGRDLISAFIVEWQSQFSELPMLATNQALCTLKVLSAIDGQRYGSDFASKVDLSQIPLWVKCASHFDL